MQTAPIVETTTFHTYSLLVGSGIRPARCPWVTNDPAVAVAKLIKIDPEAVVLGVVTQDGISPLLIGLMPGGIG